MQNEPQGLDGPAEAGSPEADVIVVGAGMSGLVAARDLRRRGVDVIVLESADRVGGRVMGVTTALGSHLDLGGQWIGAGHHRVTALAAELGLTKYDMYTEGMPDIIDRGRRRPLVSPATLPIIPALLTVDILARTGRTDRWNDTTLDRWLQKVPGRLARRFLEVLALVSWTADLDRFSVNAMTRLVREQGGMSTILATKNGAQEALLVEGIWTLAERLAAELGSRVHTDSRVTAIERDATGATVRTVDGSYRARRVIVAVPPPVAARIHHDPPLPAQRATLERDTHMGTVYKAVAVYEQPFWRDRARGELLVLDQPGRVITDSTAPGGPGHLCMLASGPEARNLADLEPDERRRVLLDPLVPHLGKPIADPVEWHEKAWHQDEHVEGGYVVVPDPGTTAGIMPHPHEPAGILHWAGAETAAEHPGYVEGAIHAGERAAGEVAAALEQSNSFS
ncbi:FAD-dependent oxidoreductase [Gordonia desulfuricans]|uniref:FAD-dependent oxidoreductase n=1 Tax=Gordonia desulfuricans TaxID=89051 RepID=A0A7K3LQN0_9ACTN|nr:MULTISPECIES: NAD(P)/FAD-dependent oxidoreductase [Gordonia]EMP11149.2 amine oxidase [Gordonia sp. NB41Y]NDK90555.1 FAD-dependent oxidoreductase [Gordonia desulfuricans]WLP88469.1 NAD(P)/FAD-dependent oxidoreductase [Gordonia sp. NB41Y]